MILSIVALQGFYINIEVHLGELWFDHYRSGEGKV